MDKLDEELIWKLRAVSEKGGLIMDKPEESVKYFRWADPNLAQSITLSGQVAVRWIERKLNELPGCKCLTASEKSASQEG